MTDGKLGNGEEFDPDAELEAAKAQLKQLIYQRINGLKMSVISESMKPGFEEWYSALVIDLIHALESYCVELGETIGKDRLSASAWVTRSILELLVWIVFCRSSRENAWRFHEDALRDVYGLAQSHAKFCKVFSIDDSNPTSAMGEIQAIAKNHLGIESIDTKFFPVSEAAKATESVWKNSFAPLNKALSKFTHPTAALIHGISHRETRRDIQISLTMQGVHFASHCVAELEGIVGSVDAVPMASGYSNTDIQCDKNRNLVEGQVGPSLSVPPQG